PPFIIRGRCTSRPHIATIRQLNRCRRPRRRRPRFLACRCTLILPPRCRIGSWRLSAEVNPVPPLAVDAASDASANRTASRREAPLGTLMLILVDRGSPIRLCVLIHAKNPLSRDRGLVLRVAFHADGADRAQPGLRGGDRHAARRQGGSLC